MPSTRLPIAHDQVLAELGVNAGSLSGDQRRQLDEQGWLLLPGVMDPSWIAAARAAFERIAVAEGEHAAREHHGEPGTRRLANLVDKDPAFRRMLRHPPLLAAVDHVLGRDFKLSSINARDPARGGGHQALHGDWGSHRGAVEPAHVVNSLWLLDDVGRDNGAPRLVPGSHRRGSPDVIGLDDPAAPHPDESVLEAAAGSVLVLNAHTWHGGTANASGRPRRIAHVYWTAREHPQQQDQRRWLRGETVAALTPAERWLCAL